jgi:hypothetical protein
MNIRKQNHRIAAIPAVLISFFIAPLAAHAGETLVGNVPFEFTVGDTTFPAGEYQFQVDQIRPDTVRVLSTNFSTAAIALSRREGGAVGDGSPSMKFNVYGGQRFLSTIQTSKGTAVALGQSTHERALAKAHSASSVALAGSSALSKARY